MTLPSLPTLRRWTTDTVPDAQRLDYWVGAISDGFLAMEASSPQREGFQGALCSVALGAVGVNWVQSSPQDVYRTRRGIARSPDNFHYLLGNLGSAWLAEQDGRRARLLPGDFVLVDSRRCYEFHFPEGPSTVSLELPLDWVKTWLAQPERQVARRIDASHGWGRALAAFAGQWRPEWAQATPLPAALLTDQLGSLLSLALGDGPPADEPLGTSATQALCGRARAQVAERLAEPGLTAQHIADALGVSVRSLHRALAQARCSFATELLAQRMAVARRMLGTPHFDRLSVAEVGRRVGYTDASHFVRTCKRHLGHTPQALRRLR
jgi:AraC-like DNA-binding protein